jgi:hypothetical protein
MMLMLLMIVVGAKKKEETYGTVYSVRFATTGRVVRGEQECQNAKRYGTTHNVGGLALGKILTLSRIESCRSRPRQG